MESFFEGTPTIFNAVYCCPVVLFLAYVPHLLRRSYVSKKLKSEGKQFTIANSRLNVSNAIDDTSDGHIISRLTGCHQNGLEAFSYFSVAVSLALATSVPKPVVNGAANLFTFLRIVYTAVYLSSANGPLRSVIWVLGVAVTVALMCCAAIRYQ